jgi:hypothetical protein
MRFATLEDIYLRFFSKLQNGERSKSSTYAAERIILMKKVGYISAVKHPRKWSSLLLPTMKSYYFLKNMYDLDSIPRPSGSYDLNTFDHDEKVLKLRTRLEDELKIGSWISDRQLRCFPELAGGLTGTYVPDAIYTTTSGEKVAFELEISVKGKERYREKVRKYLYLLGASGEDKPFTRVHFVCAKDIVRKHIEAETKLYPEYFQIEQLSKYLPINNFNK